MIMKSAEMHTRMLAGHMGGSAVLLVMGLLISPVFLAGLALIFGHGLYKVYGKTLFDDDAAMLMTLPFSARGLVLGKTFAILLWCGGMSLVVPVSGLLAAADSSSVHMQLAARIETWQLIGMRPWQAGVSAGWSVIAPVVYTGVFCLLLLALELKCSGQARKRRSRVAILLVVLLAAAIFAAVLAVQFCLREMAQMLGSGYFWAAAGVEFLLIVIGWFCYRVSVRLLETGYDLV